MFVYRGRLCRNDDSNIRNAMVVFTLCKKEVIWILHNIAIMCVNEGYTQGRDRVGDRIDGDIII